MALKKARTYPKQTAAAKAKAFAQKIGARHRTDKQKAEAFAAKVGALRATCEPLGIRLLSKADTYRQTSRTFSISVRLAASGQSFTPGFKIGCKIRARAKRIMQSVLLQ